MTKYEDGKIHGDLTLHGVTKPVVLEAKIQAPLQNPMNKKNSWCYKPKAKSTARILVSVKHLTMLSLEMR